MIFSIKEVTKRFEQRTVLDSVTIQNCITGSCIALLGKNGAGKTTLINFMIDLINVESGHLIINDKIILPDSMEWKQLIGVSSADLPLPEDFSGKDYLMFVGKLNGLNRKEIEKRSNSLANYFFGDLSILNKKIGSYSLGMKRKISLCGAVVCRPKFLILDEPFSGLDVESIELLRQFLKHYITAERLIFITSHNLRYLDGILTRIVVLDDGIIKFDGTPDVFTNNGGRQLDQALFDLLTILPKSVSELDWI